MQVHVGSLRDPREFQGLAHYLEHMLFYKTLLGQSPSVTTVNYPIQRMDDQESWLVAHNKMTQSVWTGLGGGQSQEFGKLDWKNNDEVQDWLYEHHAWHQNVRNALSL